MPDTTTPPLAVERAQVVKRIEMNMVAEDQADAMGGIDIWARHPERPEFDQVLITVHYSYAYQSNANKRDIAARIIEALARAGWGEAIEAAAKVAEEMEPFQALPDKFVPEHVVRDGYTFEERTVAEHFETDQKRLTTRHDIAAAIRALASGEGGRL